MTKTPIYCDYNAGAPVRAEAAVAMARALAIAGNPSSVHSAGRAARAAIEDAREKIATAVGASADNVVFTSGATEALHLVLDAFDVAQRKDPIMDDEGFVEEFPPPPSLVVSAVEHDALFEHARHREMLRAPVQSDGALDLAVLEGIVREAPKPALVAVQLANNETGVIQPIARIAAICREHGAMLLVDAAQAFGRLPVNIVDLDATYLVVSSHKLGGPQGVGALVIGERASVVPIVKGGGQERGRRAGTENVAGIAGFGAAATAAPAIDWIRVQSLRDDLEQRAVGLGAEIFADQAPRLPNTSCLRLPGLSSETLVIALDLKGVQVSAGSACSSGKVRPSPVLRAMGAADDVAGEAIRASLGWTTTAEEIDLFIAALGEIRDRIGRRDLRAAA